MKSNQRRVEPSNTQESLFCQKSINREAASKWMKEKSDELVSLLIKLIKKSSELQTEKRRSKSEYCAITRRGVVSSALQSPESGDKLIKPMYISTKRTMSSKHLKKPDSIISSQTEGSAATIMFPIQKQTRPSLAIVLVALALSSCILINNQTQALTTQNAEPAQPATSISSQLANSADISRSDNSKQQSDQSPSNELKPSSQSPSSSSSSNSIVASVASAVASAAAAAAVAAAQNSLSGSDGRSLVPGSSATSSSSSSSGGHHSAHQSRSSLNLAFKLADAIPEVPYSILHNMKKLDHAAPFYNVAGNRVTNLGSSKESSHSLIASALASSSKFGGAAEQLSTLFRSPMWKRIADGYGEFASEFRSLFRAPPTTMKGPANPTTKLLRDISVPALLMLLATAIPGDWRPVRTRRKSILSADSPQSLGALAPMGATDPMTASASELPGFQQGLKPNFNMAFQQLARPLNAEQSSYNQFEYPNLASSSQLARLSDINLQATPDPVSNVNWISTQPLTGQNRFEQPLQQAVRRIGDSGPNSRLASGAAASFQVSDSGYQAQHLKPVNTEPLQPSAASNNKQTSSGLFGSLTSGLSSSVNIVGQSKLMNRIMNANVNDNQKQDGSFKMMSLPEEQGSFLKRRDLFSDKHRYSLVDDSDNDDSRKQFNPNMGSLAQNSEQKLSSQSSKPFLISAVSHAIASMFNSPLESGSSSSHSASSKQQLTANENYRPLGDKTINQRDSLMRRQPQTGNGLAEQRELSQLLPQSWREVVKRTVSTVQQEATSKLKSFEGQLTNWVQDKLKTFPVASTSTSTGSTSASSPIASVVPAPVANMIASVSSTALNILGLGGKSSLPAPSSAATSGLAIEPSSSALPTRAADPTKIDQPARVLHPAKSALVGVADMIVNTLTNRHGGSSHSNPKSSTTKESDSVSVMSQYPTLTGSQPTASQSTASLASSSPSMASGTASTAAALTSMFTS